LQATPQLPTQAGWHRPVSQPEDLSGRYSGAGPPGVPRRSGAGHPQVNRVVARLTNQAFEDAAHSGTGAPVEGNAHERHGLIVVEQIDRLVNRR
jgi:hypothetical protein